MEKELGRSVDQAEVKDILTQQIARVFAFDYEDLK